MATETNAVAEKVELHAKHSVCLVLDFGSQYTQLIGRRVRSLNVYSMIKPGDITLVRTVLIQHAQQNAAIRMRLQQCLAFINLRIKRPQVLGIVAPLLSLSPTFSSLSALHSSTVPLTVFQLYIISLLLRFQLTRVTSTG